MYDVEESYSQNYVLMKESIFVFLITMVFAACSSRSKSEETANPISSEQTGFEADDFSGEDSYSPIESGYSDDIVDEDSYEDEFEDGTYSATVDYYDPHTCYSATYTLDVEVENGVVVQINFPNDGYLDDDHITPKALDSNGECIVDGEEGKTYTIHIDL